LSELCTPGVCGIIQHPHSLALATWRMRARFSAICGRRRVSTDSASGQDPCLKRNRGVSGHKVTKSWFSARPRTCDSVSCRMDVAEDTGSCCGNNVLAPSSYATTWLGRIGSAMIANAGATGRARVLRHGYLKTRRFERRSFQGRGCGFAKANSRFPRVFSGM